MKKIYHSENKPITAIQIQLRFTAIYINIFFLGLFSIKKFTCNSISHCLKVYMDKQ